ncbi:MAG: hypothetical protein ACT6S0_27125 [Roseateles sp.]|uniref:hypothetical protein n=1 Tax=Roseateles sp. TaxID=1971397 RepID=UPI004035AF00
MPRKKSRLVPGHLRFAGARFTMRRDDGKGRSALLQRWPDPELAVDEREIRSRGRPGLRAIEQLPVRSNAAKSLPGSGTQ